MEKNIFLIDSNAFLTPSKHYYRFSFAPSYWKQINELAGRGHIKTIDKVRKEVCPRKKEKDKDDIQLWYENSFNGEIISTNRINFIITENLTFILPIVKNELDLTIGSMKVIKISIMKLIE